MNDLLITRLPTLVNTEKLNLRKLRAQYKILEGDAIDQAQQLSDVCAKLHEMIVMANNLSNIIYGLCDSYEAGDQAAILLQAKRLSELRASSKSAKVH